MTCVLRRIYVHNYRCLQNFDLELQETVLLLGANGSGKTAVLDVVYGLRKLLSAEAKITDQVAFHPSTLTRWQTDPKQVFEIDADVGEESFRYRLEIEHAHDGRRSRVTWESLRSGPTTLFECEMGDVRLYRDDGSEGPTFKTDWTESALARVVPQDANRRLTAFKDAMRATVVCNIRPALLRSESTSEDRLLARHGENFVDWYRHAVQENPASSVAHVEALRALIDGFNNIHLQRSGLDSRALLLDFAGDSAAGVPSYMLRFDELSDGQRTSVVLYALLHLRQDTEGVILFLDEPDNFLALAEIQPWLLELVDLCDRTPSQAVICSHHPELIDYLGPDRGVLFVRESSTAVSARPLKALAANDGLKLSEQLARGWLE